MSFPPSSYSHHKHEVGVPATAISRMSPSSASASPSRTGITSASARPHHAHHGTTLASKFAHRSGLLPTSGSTRPSSSAAPSSPSSPSAAPAEKKKSGSADLIHKAMLVSGHIDLVFFVDATGSMQPWLDTITNNIMTLFEKQRRSMLSSSHIRVAAVTYTDFDVAAKSRCKSFDFSSSASAFQAFMKTLKADGGFDAAEDVFGGFAELFKLSWKTDSTKVLIHIADAPQHGNDYHGPEVFDEYPVPTAAQPWAFPSSTPIMEKLGRMGVQYFFGYIQRRSTDKMIAKFDEDYFRLAQRKIAQFDAMDPATVMESTFTAVMTSVMATAVAPSPSSSKLEERPYTITERVPDFNKLPSCTVTVTKQLRPETLEEVNFGERRVTKTTLKMKIAPEPFAIGGIRLAYHAMEIHPGPPSSEKRVVVKQSKFMGPKYNSKASYITDMDVQATSAFFAHMFNEDKTVSPSTRLSIKFNVAKIVSIKEPHRIMALETYLDGTYRKFNSNAGYVSDADDDVSAYMQCFSHYTFEKSKHTLIVVDLQGVPIKSGSTSEGYLLTDPAIHGINRGRYGATNTGQKGFEHFFRTHVCNGWCRKFGLPDRTRSSVSGLLATVPIPTSRTVDSPVSSSEKPTTRDSRASSSSRAPEVRPSSSRSRAPEVRASSSRSSSSRAPEVRASSSRSTSSHAPGAHASSSRSASSHAPGAHASSSRSTSSRSTSSRAPEVHSLFSRMFSSRVPDAPIYY